MCELGEGEVRAGRIVSVLISIIFIFIIIRDRRAGRIAGAFVLVFKDFYIRRARCTWCDGAERGGGGGREKAKGATFFEATEGETVRPMLDVAWAPMLGAFSVLFEEFSDSACSFSAPTVFLATPVPLSLRLSRPRMMSMHAVLEYPRYLEVLPVEEWGYLEQKWWGRSAGGGSEGVGLGKRGDWCARQALWGPIRNAQVLTLLESIDPS